MPSSTISTRLAAFGFGSDDVALLRAQGRRLVDCVPTVVDVYYRHLAGTEFAGLISAGTIDDLRRTRIDHWALLLGADFEALARHHAEQLRPRLAESGFPPSILVIAAQWFAVEMARAIGEFPDLGDEARAALVLAVVRLSFVDLALAQGAREVVWLD